MYIKARSAPMFARESARWSADSANVQARKMCSSKVLLLPSGWPTFSWGQQWGWALEFMQRLLNTLITLVCDFTLLGSH
eukprot:scaffold23209_cov105-Skeletonema_marinoi.AAC.1